MKFEYTMWGLYGRNGGLVALFRSKWKAENFLWRDDQYIQRVEVAVK